MTNRTRLFKKFPRDLVELRGVEFDKERNLHDMVEQNIRMLFPELVVLDSEFERDGYRPDTVAFDKRRNTFAIIEYKNRQDSKVLDQASAYLVHMNRIKDSFELLYLKKTGDRSMTEFDWKGAYAIIVSPEFTRIQIDSAQTSPSLTLYTVSVYEDGIISLTWVAGDEKRSEPNLEKGGATPAHAPKSGDQLYRIARARLLEEFPGSEVNEKPKAYNGFRYPGKNYFCTIYVQKRKIDMAYRDKEVPIENEADFEQALADMKGLFFDTPDDGADARNGMDRLYSDARATLLTAFPGMVEKRMKMYDRFEMGGRLLCTMGKQRSKIWLHYSGCTANPAPDQDDFVGFVEVPGWGIGRWRSAIRSWADFDRALSILKGLYGRK